MSAADNSSVKLFFANLNDFAGLVTFASVLVMLTYGHYRVRFDMRSTVRAMVYFDAAAFFFAYLAYILNSQITRCQYVGIWFVADFFFAFKDACKYSYIVYRCLRVMLYKNMYPAYATGVISLVLYFIYMGFGYTFDESKNCQRDQTGEEGHRVVLNQAVIALYSFWTLVDIAVSVVMMQRVAKVVKSMTEMDTEKKKHHMYRSLLVREESRLLISTLAMFGVTVWTIVKFAVPKDQANGMVLINSVTFVYVQMWLLISSFGVRTSNEGNSSHRQSSTGGGHNSSVGHDRDGFKSASARESTFVTTRGASTHKSFGDNMDDATQVTVQGQRPASAGGTGAGGAGRKASAPAPSVSVIQMPATSDSTSTSTLNASRVTVV